MLQDECKLNVADPVAKYLPEFAKSEDPFGQARPSHDRANPHPHFRLGEASGPEAQKAKDARRSRPRSGSRRRCNMSPAKSGNTHKAASTPAARIVEVVGGMTFDAFLQKRLFDPLGMKAHDLLPHARIAFPTGHRLCEKQRDRFARTGAAARRVRPARPSAAGQRRTLFHRARLRALLPDAAQRRQVQRPAAT